MKIEVLFSEICNQFGDPQNAEYLRQVILNTGNGSDIK